MPLQTYFDESYTTLSYEQHYRNALAMKLNPNNHSFPDSDSEIVNSYLNSRLFFEWERTLSLQLNSTPDLPAVYAIFDKYGNLIKMRGNHQTYTALENAGIRESTLWDLEKLGPNAITVGLRQKQSFQTSGRENYNTMLQDFTIYFTPIIINREIPPYDTMDLGGIAIFTNVSTALPHYMTILNFLAHDLTLNIESSQITNNLYDRSNDSVLCLDVCVEEYPLITYCSHTLFEILNIPMRNIRFHDVREIIDPLPENQDFWDIVNQMKRAKDLPVTLSSGGQKIACIISTDLFNQERMLHSKGLYFFITTSRRISSQISKKMANTAIMTFDKIIGKHPAFFNVVTRAKMFSNTQSNIMLIGESGVGKDVFAQCIHNASDRRNKPFIAINCGAIPRDLIATELFGYDAGAFTGAKKQGNIGKFELADGGTIFLDEIGELPLDLQATLLRIVEQKRFMRMGGSKEIEIDVKIISATNVNLPEMIQNHQFRADLFYRLSTLILEIPPLRNRGNDILLLSDHIVQKIAARLNRTAPVTFTSDAKELLVSYPWPGNVRELQNTLERVVQLYPYAPITSELILSCMQQTLWTPEAPEAHAAPPVPDISSPWDKKQPSEPLHIDFPVSPVSNEPKQNSYVKPNPDTTQYQNPDRYQQSDQNPYPDQNQYQQSDQNQGHSQNHNSSPNPGQNPGQNPCPRRKEKRPSTSLTKESIEHALEVCGGNRCEAAKYLKIARKTLYRNMERFDIPLKFDR